MSITIKQYLRKRSCHTMLHSVFGPIEVLQRRLFFYTTFSLSFKEIEEQFILACTIMFWNFIHYLDCPKLNVPVHGSLTSTAVVHGTQVAMICVSGFTTFGNNSRKCIDGQWTGDFTTCEAGITIIIQQQLVFRCYTDTRTD